MSGNGDPSEKLALSFEPFQQPFRLRVNDYVRIDGHIGRVVRVTESAAVVLVNQPHREFTTRFDKQVEFQPPPKRVRIAANSEIEILNRPTRAQKKPKRLPKAGPHTR